MPHASNNPHEDQRAQSVREHKLCRGQAGDWQNHRGAFSANVSAAAQTSAVRRLRLVLTVSILKRSFCWEISMKTLFAMAVASVSLLTTGVSLAQNGNMMNGGAWGSGWMGGYGGVWMPLLLVIVVAGLVAWIVKRGGK